MTEKHIKYEQVEGGLSLWNTSELEQALSLLGVKPDHPTQFRKELLKSINQYAGAMHNEPVAFQSKAMLLLLEKEGAE